MTKVKEDELLERVYKVLEDVGKETFVEEVNRILGTEYTEKDIDWEE